MADMVRVVAFAGEHLLVLLGLALTAYVAGRMASQRLDLADAWERAAVALALGLSILAHLGLLLGFFHLLSRNTLIVAALAVHGAGLGVWRELAGAAKRFLAAGPGRSLAIGLAALAALAPLFVLALYPPAAFDETSYHLPVARGFASSHGVPFLPALRFPVFPHLGNVLFAAMLLLSGDTAAHLVQLLAAVTTSGLLVAWGRRLSSPAAGWMAAALFLGYPIVAYLAGTGYVDCLFTLFVTAGLYGLDRWRESGRAGWLAAAAALTASAAATKFHGLFFVAALLVPAAAAAPQGRKARSLLLALVVSLAVLAPWYGRILYYTGDPLFPSPLSSASPWAMTPLGPSVGERLEDLPTLPWDVLFRRRRVGEQPPFSPAFLLGLPLVVAGAIRDRRIRRLAMLAGTYLLVLLFAPPDARYLVAVVPVLSLAMAAELGHWTARRRRLGIVPVLCVLFVLPGWLYAGYRIGRQGRLPASERQREAYLNRRLPLYPAIAWLNRTRGSAYVLYALYAENMRYFADGRFLGDWNGPASYGRVLAAARDAESFDRELRRLGATHLLIPERGIFGQAIVPPVAEDDAFTGRFRLVYRDPAARLYALRSREGGLKRR
jgi:4-amino-4-deoxy-L-arabinose transferase-like glycosyltransferase